jgi:hypothetical protein
VVDFSGGSMKEMEIGRIFMVYAESRMVVVSHVSFVDWKRERDCWFSGCLVWRMTVWHFP